MSTECHETDCPKHSVHYNPDLGPFCDEDVCVMAPLAKAAIPVAKSQPYKVKVYVDHGYFEYEVGSMEQALAHGEVIMRHRTYRRSTESGDVEFLHVIKVKVSGPNLRSEYMDTFKRT